MPKFVFKLVVALSVVLLVSCAKRGSLSGGNKDTIAPVLKAGFPENFSTNFNGNEIELVFDEYVRLKEVNKQLIISPPLKNQPTITPSNASKKIKIVLNDTLLKNTTYSLNFGQSIIDNNEGNPYPQFKYVFSTGNYIDSLKLKVKVRDAIEKKVDNYVSVMLYEINEKYNDSTIFKETPKYISNTLDNPDLVTLENLNAGKYLLIALKDNGNNKYNPGLDKIGFQKQFVSIPNDTVFELELFKEVLPFKAFKPSQASKNRLLIGHQGNAKNTQITLKNGSEIIPTTITRFPKKDSLQIWFKPVKADSLSVWVEKEKYSQSFSVTIKNQKPDTLSIRPEFTGTLPLRERFALNSSIPLQKISKSGISITNKDAQNVDFSTEYDDFNQKLYIDFSKESLEKYKITMMPGTLTDIYENTTDTLKYSLSTRNISDYGNLKIVLENVKKFPVIVELTDKEGVVKAVEYLENKTVAEFLSLEPNLYSLRIIYDDNRNKVWDTGSFREKRQTEEVIYFPKEIDVRTNWDVEQVFKLED